MGWEGSGGGGYVCGFHLLIRDQQKCIDQLVKIPKQDNALYTLVM